MLSLIDDRSYVHTSPEYSIFCNKNHSFQLNGAPTFNYFINYAMISYIKQTNMHIQITLHVVLRFKTYMYFTC